MRTRSSCGISNMLGVKFAPPNPFGNTSCNLNRQMSRSGKNTIWKINLHKFLNDDFLCSRFIQGTCSLTKIQFTQTVLAL